MEEEMQEYLDRIAYAVASALGEQGTTWDQDLLLFKCGFTASIHGIRSQDGDGPYTVQRLESGKLEITGSDVRSFLLKHGVTVLNLLDLGLVDVPELDAAELAEIALDKALGNPVGFHQLPEWAQDAVRERFATMGSREICTTGEPSHTRGGRISGS